MESNQQHERSPRVGTHSTERLIKIIYIFINSESFILFEATVFFILLSQTNLTFCIRVAVIQLSSKKSGSTITTMLVMLVNRT